MRKSIICILSALTCFAAMPANANWEYSGTYLGDGWYTDDGSRFVLSVRGGAAIGFASIKNEMGTLMAHYWADSYGYFSESYCGGGQACAAAGYEYLGYGNIGGLSAKEDFSEFSFAAGASLGWTIPNRPQWRIEAGWDHISEMEYNQSPMFEGDLTLTGGSVDGIVIHAESGAVQSKLSTDIISVMAFYDFFDGMQKPMRKFIPYVGLGVGYADSKATLNLTDLYGDLSEDLELRNFGEYDEDSGIVQFNHSKTDSSNIAGLAALGLSYGISQNMFMDLGVRFTYIPKIKWSLESTDGNRKHDWFSAENMIYTNIMLGLRFEF